MRANKQIMSQVLFSPNGTILDLDRKLSAEKEQQRQTKRDNNDQRIACIKPSV
jgi:hypothetical protein